MLAELKETRHCSPPIAVVRLEISTPGKAKTYPDVQNNIAVVWLCSP